MNDTSSGDIERVRLKTISYVIEMKAMQLGPTARFTSQFIVRANN